MGVPGLIQYVSRSVPHERVNLTALARDQPLGTITLAVDISGLAYHLYRANRLACATGGEYARLYRLARRFADGLQRRGVALRGVVDGIGDRAKLDTSRSRLEKAARDMFECVRRLRKHGTACAALPFVKPLLLVDVVVAALRDAGVVVERSFREADDDLARLARPGKGCCHAILSNDSDMLVYDTGPLVMFDDLQIAEEPSPGFPQGFAVARLYRRERVAACLGIPPYLLPALASLVGTDSTPGRQELHDRLSKRSGNSST